MYVVREGMIKALIAGGPKPTLEELTTTLQGYKDSYKAASNREQFILLRSAKEVKEGFCSRADVPELEKEKLRKALEEFKEFTNK